MRDEMAGVYKTQGQNTQRLLAMTETLREKEELSRVDAEALRKSKDELTILRRKVDQHNEIMTEKDRTVQVCFEQFLLSILLDDLSHYHTDPSRRNQHSPT